MAVSQHRLYLASRLDTGRVVQLDADRAHYLLRVLRLKPGQDLLVFDGESGEYSARLTSAGRNSAELHVGERRVTRTESALKVHLVQGVSRGDRMDWVVQKATELGVKRISPVFTAFGVVRLQADRATRRLEHWRKVAVGAAEQSGRTKVPLIDPPMSLNAWLGSAPGKRDRDVILHPGAAGTLSSLSPPRTKLCVLVGPEGGFSVEEYRDAELAGFKAVSLGPRILRTETAAVAALAVAQFAWGDLKSGRS